MKSRNVSKSCLLAGLMALFPWGLAQAVTVTAGTTAQTADAVERLLITNRDFAFGLNNPVMGHTDASGRVIGPLPADVSLTDVVLYDLADVGEASLSRANLPTVSVLSDDTLLGTANYTEARDPIEVFLADGSTLSLRPVRYAFTEPVSVNATGTYTLRLNAAGVTPSLPLFTNAASNAGFLISGHREKAPYVSFVCEAGVSTVSKTVSGTASLTSLGITDNASTVAVITLEADATLMLDESVSKATLIFETAAPAANAPTVTFTENAAFEGSFVFRNAQGSDNGAIRVTGPWQDSASNDSLETWVPNSENPDAVTVDCDLILASPLPLIASGWFQANAIRVRPGRTLLLETEANTPSRLPDVLLTAPTATLALADTEKAAAATEKPSIPEKYRAFFSSTSGTVTVERPVKFAVKGGEPGTEQDSQGSIFRIGSPADQGYQMSLVLDADFDCGNQRILLGGKSGSATLHMRQGTATFRQLSFDGGAILRQDAGTLTLGTLGDWDTKFLGDSATLVFGDGDHLNGTATATLYGIPYGSASGSVTTVYRGAADITVKADATLVLNKGSAKDTSVDYALYPAGKRSLKVQGGVVQAVGGDVTMDFENPEPQAVPMAVAEIPGLEVIGAANLESADTANSSLSLDALKGDGTVTIGGTVTIVTVKSLAGTSLTLDGDPARAGFGELSGTIGAVSGTGIVLFGDLGAGSDTATDTVQRIADSLEAGGFTGTVGFLVGNVNGVDTEKDFPIVDFSATDVADFPYTIQVQPGQTLVMRVDQYLEANIAWPADPDTATLILIEAGPYGGEVSVPAWPENVDFRFDRYTDDKGNHEAMDGNEYTAVRDDNGIDINISWENPKLDGNVAWIDMEFNNDSYNTGWKRLTSIYGDTSDEYNGMLRGDGGSGADQIMTTRSYFADTWNPSGRGLQVAYHPYISKEALEYPEQWTLVTRFRMPEYSNTVGITIGANYTGAPDFAGEDYGVLVLATGQLKGGTTRGIVTDDDMESDELFLWYIPNNSTEGMVKLATINVPCVTESYHLLTIRYDRGHVQIFFEGNQLADVILPEGAKIGPGMQFGKLMGSDQYVDEGLRDMLEYVKSMHVSDDENKERVGVVDFLRIYRGLITDTALHQLVCQYPYTHQDRITNEFVSNVRYVRELNDGGPVQWVQEGAWRREYTSDGISWAGNDYYAEPAEGAVVIIECGTTTTIEVNTTKHGVFPSADRTYAQLIVRDGWKVGWWERRTGDLTIKPCEGWYTKKVSPESDEYKYGRIIFSGGAGQAAAWREDDEEKGGSADAAITWNNLTLHASVVDISRAGLSFKDRKTVEVRVEDPAFFRDTPEDTLMFVKQLTGPVSGTGLFSANTDLNAIDYFRQESEFVWVPACYKTGNWKIDDVTRPYNPSIEENGDVKRPKTGLFVRALRVPGILYLEQNEDAVNGNGELSAQAWYRYGYHNDTAEESAWGLTPVPMMEGDFEKASILKIRLKNDTTETLRVNTNPDIRELHVEAPKSDSVATDEGLRLLPGIGGTRLTVADEIVTERRLEVYDPAVQGSEAGGTGLDGILLQPKTEEVVDVDDNHNPTQIITGGTLLHGVGSGVYAAGNTKVNYPLDGSSIARIESVNAVTFAAAQDLSGTTVAAAKDAIVEQTGADNAFRAKAMELAQGSRFRFASSAATVDEGITLTGNATLEGTGNATLEGTGNATLEGTGMTAALTPTEGVTGQTGTETLTLDAADGADWKLLNREVGGLPLTKVGAGVADIATDLPPNAGFVDVQEGTLRVATGLAGEGQAVGQKSLKVAEGATLAPTFGTIADDVLAEIPAEQSVSGLGRIAGWLRLTQGATLAADDVRADASLSVGGVLTDGLEALADVSVTLPATTAEGLVFLRSDEEALNWAARKRLAAATVAEPPVSWDVALRYAAEGSDPTKTEYLTALPGIDKPAYPGDETNPEGKPNDGGDPDGDYSDGVQDDLDDQYHNAGMLGGASQGYTRANTTLLSAGGVENAYTCFNNVWTLAQRTDDAASVEYATVDLLLAYEFGISAMRRVTATDGTDQLLVTVTLRNALGTAPFYGKALLNGADGLKPTYADDVALSFALDDQPVEGTVTEISAAAAKAYGVAEESTLDASRYFLIPYSEAFLGQGLTVRAAKAAASAE